MTALKHRPLLYYPDFYPDATWLRSMLLLTDGVARIVPADVPLDDPESLREIAGELGALTNVVPTEHHISPIGYAAEWLDRTFSVIAQSKAKGVKGLRMAVSPEGNVTFAGKTLVYDQKLTETMRSMLETHSLIDQKTQSLFEKLTNKNRGLVINTAAADAILSFIADNIARDFGYTAITSHPLDFAMNSLKGLNIPVHAPSGASEGMLASAFASFLLPKEIGVIRFSDYKILRERSEGLRSAFNGFVQKCHDTCRFDRIENTARLQQEVADAAKTVEEEFVKFQTTTSKSCSFVKNWWPVAVAGLLYHAKDFAPPEFSLPLELLGGGTFLFKVFERMEKVLVPKEDETKQKVFNLCAELGSDIQMLPRVRELLHSR